MATLVLGISRGGIGSALAKVLYQAGKPVHVAGRNSQVLNELSSDFAGITVSNCDITQESSIKQAVAEAVDQYGGISGLAYCAGSIQLKPISQMTPEAMQETVSNCV
jgi:NAD(P)-dependent dehydrogenase (short-subunit alcohol dehydrogenase family)